MRTPLGVLDGEPGEAMTKDDLLERVAFWQAGLMDVDHLRDVAYDAVESEFDCVEFRLIAGDSRLESDDARDLLGRGLRAAGLDLPSREAAERIVSASIARSVLAGTIDPMWGADYIGNLDASRKGLPPEVWGPLVYDSCPCCNGLDEMVGAKKRASRMAECREDIRAHLRECLPAIVAWAGVSPSDGAGPGFLGWRRPLESRRVELRDIERRIRWILLRTWDPIGVSHSPEARDEYDGYIPRIQRLLLTDATEAALADELKEYLRLSQVDGMGLEDDGASVRRREVVVEELLALRPAP